VPDSFVHLHQHTEYSMLDGAARIGDVVASAVADGQPAMGITDHGNMYGILDFYKECRKQGVTPIIGTEAYMAHDSRFERPPRRGRVDDSGGEVDGGKKLYYHLTLLAENAAGYRNLIQLASRAYMEGYYYKPRVDWDTLAEHHEGVIATTGCLGGHVLQSLMNEGFDAALEKAARLQDIFGRDNLFVEIQDHGIPEQHRTNPQLLEIAKKIQAPLLATNDSHYVHRGDAVAHDALLCVQTASLMSDPDRFKFHGDEHYLKTAQEMRHLFSEVPESCDNTLWIAERANVEIDFGNPQLPNFPLPEGFTDDAAYLEHLTFEGARKRWGDDLPDNVVERLAYELKVIGDMGFSSYFLIVWDLIKHARDSGIRVGPGRGSAAGCAVAYTLWITDLDPIKYDLLFERFLNPSRISMPDIDMDFDSRYRDEMIRYAAERYGRDHVAQIVTFSTIKARAAVRDAARVLGKPYIVGDKVAKAMPPLIMGRDTPLYACLEEHPKFVDGYKMAGELRDMYHTDPEIKEVVDVAKGLEGLRRGDGIHAAAVVITKEPLTEYLPIQRKPEAGVDIEDAPVVTQYEMHGVEELGLLKMDFLGLRNLDVISDTLELIERTRGITVDIDDVDLADGPTYELLRRADTIGVFQLEGGPMRALIRSLAPTEFEDVAALVALYRPGPMAANMHTDYADRKNGRQEISYLHPDAEEILGDTYGLCLTGDTVVVEARTGRPMRLDEIDPSADFWVQGVDDDLHPVVRQVTHWVDNGVRDTVTLTLSNGMTLTGTPDHPVLTERGWVGLGELTSDDHVATAPELVEPVAPVEVSNARLRILGYLIGDGSLATGSAIAFVNKDDRLLDEFEAVVAREFPTTRPSRYVGANGVTKITIGNGKGNGGGASPLLRWLRELGMKAPVGSPAGGVLSHEKYVPGCVFEASNDAVARFLAALWDCDGHVGERMAFYRTVSPRLAEDVRRLLVRLGFDAAVYSADYTTGRGADRTAFQVTVYDGPRFAALIAPHLVSEHKRGALFDAESRGTTLPRAEVMAALRAASSTSVRQLAGELAIPRWHFSPYAAERHPRVHVETVSAALAVLELPEVDRRRRINWTRVESVEPAGPQRVFDITVDDIHNFVANGIVAHNCIYQEGIMRIAQRFAGYSLADADNLRKACLPAGSMMWTADGGVPIEQVMARRDRRILTIDQRSGRPMLADVDDIWSVGRKGVFRVRTAGGRSIEATADHPLLVGEEWTPLSRVQIGDAIATSSTRTVGPDPVATARGDLLERAVVGTRRGALVWDTVVGVEFVGEEECFDFRMANEERPYAVVEDFLVHNCGKKVRELIAKERTKFVEGCEATGYGAELGTAWFDIIEPFADYAFNKSHSYGYGFVAYQTAYLKANYPAEYLSALLTSVKSSLEKAAIYLAECRAIGIEVTVPDVNRSLSDFAPVVPEPNGDGATADTGSSQILFGLSAVRNVGEGLVELILAERDENGPFEDFYDFCQRVNTQVLNKRTIESLIKAGGFDSMGHPRQGLLTVFEQIVDATIARRKEHDMGVMSLFGELEDGPAFDEKVKIPDVEFDKKQRLAFEKEMLGLYVSDHPLLGAEQALKRKVDCTVLELNDLDDGTQRTIGGVITGLQRKWTKKGDLMAVFVLEDLQGSVEVMVFPKTMAQIGHLLVEDAVVVTTGRVDKRDETAKFIPRELELFEPVIDEHPPLRLHLPPSRLDDETIGRLQELIVDFPGESEVHILLGERQVLRLSDDHLVNTQSGIIGELRALLGHESVVL
jgi:DNA polymerase-3 subunit alpha